MMRKQKIDSNAQESRLPSKFNNKIIFEIIIQCNNRPLYLKTEEHLYFTKKNFNRAINNLPISNKRQLG